MKKLIVLLLALFVLSVPVYADELVMEENFNDGSCYIMSSSGTNLSGNIINADAGDEDYVKVYKTFVSSTSDIYFDLGRTFTKEDANIAKISFDIKAPMVDNKNVLFYFGDSQQLGATSYNVLNTNYRKKAFYFRTTGVMGINADTATTGSWYKTVDGTSLNYTQGGWYHIDITVDLYKQTATYTLNGNPWGTTAYGGGGTFDSFDFIGVRTEATNKTGYWYIDNIKVYDATVEVDKTILYQENFEKVDSVSDTALTFAYGAANSSLYDTGLDDYGQALKFVATETTTSRFKVPVNATDTKDKSIMISFDLYAEEAAKEYCMIYLYDAAGTDYKILARNSNLAAGKTGFFKFLNIGAPWEPTGTVTSPAKSWVHIDGIFEFKDNQTVIRWYFDNQYAGITYSYAMKDISYIRLNVNKTETAGVTTTFAIDNILMRQYETGEFTTSYELTGTNSQNILTITPLTTLSNGFSVSDCDFTVTNAITGEAATVDSKEYIDGKIVLKISNIDSNGTYIVSSPDFTDLFDQKMKDFEFYALPVYADDGSIIPDVNAVWYYDYDGNRLNKNAASSEVNMVKIIFNTPMDSSTLEKGITFGSLSVNGEYNTKDNSYTLTWDGFLPPQSTAYILNITGAKSKINKSMADYSESVTISKGAIAVKSVELLNSLGEAASSADAGEGAELTAKVSVLNTTGTDENAVLNYGIYKNGYMETSDYADVYLTADRVNPLTIEVPYTDSEQIIKIFLWDAFSTHESYFSGFEFVAE